MNHQTKIYVYFWLENPICKALFYDYNKKNLIFAPLKKMRNN